MMTCILIVFILSMFIIVGTFVYSIFLDASRSYIDDHARILIRKKNQRIQELKQKISDLEEKLYYANKDSSLLDFVISQREKNKK